MLTKCCRLALPLAWIVYFWKLRVPASPQATREGPPSEEGARVGSHSWCRGDTFSFHWAHHVTTGLQHLCTSQFGDAAGFSSCDCSHDNGNITSCDCLQVLYLSDAVCVRASSPGFLCKSAAVGAV